MDVDISCLEPFEYTPLVDSDEIRLIRFGPKWSVEVFHTSLEKAPTYRALSYAWGDSRTSHNVAVAASKNGATQAFRLAVTNSCASALRRLYQDDCLTPVWIDAICIDQKTVLERNHQVGLMSRIYNGAKKVQIYLGDAHSNSNEAMEYIGQALLCYLTIRPGSRPLEDCQKMTLEACTAPRTGVDALFRRPWFERIWVVQEIHHARYAEVLCGTYKVPWLAFQLVTPSFRGHMEPHNEKCTSVLGVGEGNIVNRDLASLLRMTRNCKATDSRDKVFALLSLAVDTQSETRVSQEVAQEQYLGAFEEWFRCLDQKGRTADEIFHRRIPEMNRAAEFESLAWQFEYRASNAQRIVNGGQIQRPKLNVVPDYDKESNVVFAEVAKEMIRTTQNLDILQELSPEVCVEVLSGTRLGFPSWAPNWAEDAKWHNYLLTQTKPIEVPDCSGKMRTMLKSTVDVLELQVQAKLIATIIESNDNLKVQVLRRFASTDNAFSPKNLDYVLAAGLISLHNYVFSPKVFSPLPNPRRDLRRFRRASGEPCKIVDIANPEEVKAVPSSATEILWPFSEPTILPKHAQKADQIFLLRGASMPYVLRHIDGDYVVVGECFVPGVMEGELVNSINPEKGFGWVTLR